MSNLNLMRPPYDIPEVEETPAAEVTPTPALHRPRGPHRHRTELMVLIVGLFILAWMILMQDVRVGLPGLVTVAPAEARSESPDVGGSPKGSRPMTRPTAP